MASSRLKETKDGKQFYEITVSRGRNATRVSMRWYVPQGWSKKSIENKLKQVSADFERDVKEGKVISKQEQKQIELEQLNEENRKPTFRKYVDDVFMPAKEAYVAENTRDSFRRMFDKHILGRIGDIKIAEIIPKDITKIFVEMQKEGLSHATIIKCHMIINLVFKMAYMDETIDSNPMFRVERPKPRKDELKESGEPPRYTEEELAYILTCLKKEPTKWQAMIYLLADTGARIGEACGLYWENIDFQKGLITIDKQLQYTQAKGVYETTPKNRKSRTIPCPQELLNILKKLREEQADKAISKYVFTQDESFQPMHPTSPKHYMYQFGKRYGIADFHPHKLRHTFASVAITSGADIASVSAILGHSNPSVTTRIYTHATEESMRKASEVFSQAIKQA